MRQFQIPESAAGSYLRKVAARLVETRADGVLVYRNDAGMTYVVRLQAGAVCLVTAYRTACGC